MPGGSNTNEMASLTAFTSKKRKKTTSPMEKGGWDNNTSSLKFPQYDAANDKHCPYTHTKKFIFLHTKMQKMEEIEKKRKINSISSTKSNSGGITYLDSNNSSIVMSNSKMLLDSPSTSPMNYSKNFNPATIKSLSNSLANSAGSITWQMEEMGDPTTELEVIKCIILREGYLSRLKQLIKSKTIVQIDLLEIIDLARLVSVEVVECIMRWRKNQNKSHPFIWNGFNYLIKMSCDLDFLDTVESIQTWYIKEN